MGNEPLVTPETSKLDLDKVIGSLGELGERYQHVRCPDQSSRVNQGAPFVRHLGNMLRLSRVIAEGARARDESRGAHFKPAFENRNDADWLRTTLASAKEDGTPKFIRDFTYECAGKSVSINKTRKARIR